MSCDHVQLFAMYGGAYAPVSCPYCPASTKLASLEREVERLRKENESDSQALDSLRETMQDLADDLCGLQPVMTMDECVVAITQHDLELRQDRERLQRERDAIDSELTRLRPVVEAAREWAVEACDDETALAHDRVLLRAVDTLSAAKQGSK